MLKIRNNSSELYIYIYLKLQERLVTLNPKRIQRVKGLG